MTDSSAAKLSLSRLPEAIQRLQSAAVGLVLYGVSMEVTVGTAVSRKVSWATKALRRLTKASKPDGACITELGCSSSSDRGFEACSAAFVVSSYDVSALPSHSFDWRTPNPGLADLGGSGVVLSSCSCIVSSISVVSVPVEEVAIGEGSGTSLGLSDARGEL